MDVSVGKVLSDRAIVAHTKRHARRIKAHLGTYFERRALGIKQPVEDFLFVYYRFKPSRLLRWLPGISVRGRGEAAEAWLDLPGFVRFEDGTVGCNASLFPEGRRAGLAFAHEVLQQTQLRSPQFGCSGRHEWAMVYRADAARHAEAPLRVDAKTIAAVVEDGPLLCTHFDAFRFFEPEAKPLNAVTLSRELMPMREQPGCLHSNMDIYRWAFKLYPFVSSDVLLDAFLFALRVRRVDMRASPYDAQQWGLAPICIETEEGRRQYRSYQKTFYEQGRGLRARLLREIEQLRAYLPTEKQSDANGGSLKS